MGITRGWRVPGPENLPDTGMDFQKSDGHRVPVFSTRGMPYPGVSVGNIPMSGHLHAIFISFFVHMSDHWLVSSLFLYL